MSLIECVSQSLSTAITAKEDKDSDCDCCILNEVNVESDVNKKKERDGYDEDNLNCVNIESVDATTAAASAITEQQMNNKRMNVLCLGGSDSGKSTFVNTLTEQYQSNSKAVSTSEHFECLCRHMSQIAKSYRQDGHERWPECSEMTNKILFGGEESTEDVSSPKDDEIQIIITDFERIWSTCLKSYYEKNKDAKHFTENMNQVFKNGKLCLQKCKYQLYNSTNSTQRETIRRFSTSHELNLVTAGGKKMERRRWNSLDLEGTNVLLLFVSLSEFNQQSIEDSKTNRMDESLKTFKELLTKKQLKNSRKVVIFSKPDILQEKLSVEARYQRQVCDSMKEELKSMSNLNLERSVLNSTINEYENLFQQYCKDSKFDYHVCNTTNEEEVQSCMQRIVSNNSQPFISNNLKRKDEKFINKLYSSLNNKFSDISFV
ncbi:predicted protein [Naegleria gruberi]|uniref:Predicted protein n=1 Tax=Naegleria gruberi TaxID=5762 RepID=D2VG73_NAEGR|nr:uncharacterized protein NAEGRDRAFT_49275 [Naegleria gruberi]EFC44299.1 predicted protein [Naegleria gruberi]|eukprot:XP_002677043.1 predicted protein [Naegleria gruberi strain NEG-M]